MSLWFPPCRRLLLKAPADSDFCCCSLLLMLQGSLTENENFCDWLGVKPCSFNREPEGCTDV